MSVINKLKKLNIFKTLTRRTLDQNLIPILLKYSKGKILDIGALDCPYKKYLSYNKYQILDIKKRKDIDYNMDIHKTNIANNSFDTIIATEVFEHLYNPFQACNEIHRILKPKGYLIASTRFIYHYHGEPNDYFRFTEFGLKRMFKNYKSIKIIPLGNRLMSILDIISTKNTFFKVIFRPINILINTRKIHKTKAPLGFIVVAQK